MQMYPFYPQAFDEGTAELTLEETGAYIRLLNALYSRDGRLADDLAMLSRVLRCDPRTAKRLRNRLVEVGKLATSGGLLTNFRATSVIAKVVEKSEAARNAANNRWKNNDSGHATADASAYADAYATNNLNKELKESSLKTQTRSAPTEQASKRGPATALPTGAPARSEGTRKAPSPEPRSGSNYAVNTPATIPEMDRAAADRQKMRGGMSPDDGLDKRYPPARRPPEHQQALQPLPDQPMKSGPISKRPSSETFTAGNWPQCATCNCPASPSGEVQCWANILANSSMAKLPANTLLNSD